MINPLAEELNRVISESNQYVLEMMTDFGKRLYFPKGILSQTAEANEKASQCNATIGIAKEKGEAMHLNSIMVHFSDLAPNDVLPYAPAFGKPKLREKWQEKIFHDNPSLEGKKISKPIVTSGVTNGLSLCVDMFVNKGDVLLLPDKIWGNYNMIFGLRGGADIQTYSLFSTNNEGIDLDSFRNKLLENVPRGKIIVIFNFPNNPTGYSITVEEAYSIKNILFEITEKECNIVVICDDAYFDLFYDEDIFKESLFTLLADCHDRILAVKLDGVTKEMFAWGFRTGFMTFSTIVKDNRLFDAMEKKCAGAIRSSISNSASHSQSIVLDALNDSKFEDEKKKTFSVLKARAVCARNILNNERFSSVWQLYPFNSGYFMCIKLKEINAETYRKKLLEKYGIGVIATNGTDIRIAISCVEESELQNLFDTMYKCALEMQSKS